MRRVAAVALPTRRPQPANRLALGGTFDALGLAPSARVVPRDRPPSRRCRMRLPDVSPPPSASLRSSPPASPATSTTHPASRPVLV